MRFIHKLLFIIFIVFNFTGCGSEGGTSSGAVTSPSISLSSYAIELDEDSDGEISLTLGSVNDGSISIDVESDSNVVSASYESGVIKLVTSDVSEDIEAVITIRASNQDNKTTEVRATVSVLNHPEKRILAIGDSLTASIHGPQYRTRLANLSGLEVVNFGVGGQTSTNIAARMGVLDVTITLANPVSSIGTYEIESIENSPLTSQGTQHVDCEDRSDMTCELVRDYDTGIMYIHITELNEILAKTLTLKMKKPMTNTGDLAVVWIGRNNLSQTSIVERDAQLIKNWLTNEGVSYVFLSVLNAESEVIGTSAYSNISTINTDLSIVYSENYLDIRSMLISNYDPSVAADVVNYYGDTVPSSLRADTIHLNQDGYDIVSMEIYNFFYNKNFF